MINQSVYIGRLTRDPLVNIKEGIKPRASFALAVNRPFESEDGSKADFINCIAWDKKALIVQEYLKKGSRIAVIGKTRSRFWEYEPGKKVNLNELHIDEITFLETKEETEAQEFNLNKDPFGHLKIKGR